MSGAPRELALAGDFVLVRMALVDEVGLPAAILFQRIAWRCERFPEGWPATYDELQAETRLSEWQVKAAVKLLRERGWIVSERADRFDPTQRWRPVFAGAESGPAEGGILPHVGAESSRTVKAESSRTVKVESSRTSYKTPETKSETFSCSPDGERVTSAASVSELFEEFWAAYPRKVGKVKARAAYAKALAEADASVILAGAEAYAADPNRAPEFTAHPTTWLNRGGWDDEPLPSRAPRGGADRQGDVLRREMAAARAADAGAGRLELEGGAW